MTTDRQTMERTERSGTGADLFVTLLSQSNVLKK